MRTEVRGQSAGGGSEVRSQRSELIKYLQILLLIFICYSSEIFPQTKVYIEGSSVYLQGNKNVNAVSLEIEYPAAQTIEAIVPADNLPDKKFFVANPNFPFDGQYKKLRIGWFSFGKGIDIRTPFKLCDLELADVSFKFNTGVCEIADGMGNVLITEFINK